MCSEEFTLIIMSFQLYAGATQKQSHDAVQSIPCILPNTISENDLAFAELPNMHTNTSAIGHVLSSSTCCSSVTDASCRL